MFGCHKCPHNGENSNSYLSSPCASCATAKDPVPVSRYSDDPASFASLMVMHPAYDDDPKAVIDQALTALGQCVKLLISLKELHPDTYKFVQAKMEKPGISYSELASMFNCRKQNVLYHFRKAVRLHPELSHALIVDKRFLGGRSSALSPRAFAVRTPQADAAQA